MGFSPLCGNASDHGPGNHGTAGAGAQRLFPQAPLRAVLPDAGAETGRGSHRSISAAAARRMPAPVRKARAYPAVRASGVAAPAAPEAATVDRTARPTAPPIV